MAVRDSPPVYDPRARAIDQAPAFAAAAPPLKAFPYWLEVIVAAVALLLLASFFIARCVLPRTVVAVRPIEKGSVIAKDDVALVAVPGKPSFRKIEDVQNRVAANGVAAGRPLRASDVGAALPAARKALRDIAPYRILTAADVAKPPEHAVSVTAVKKDAFLPETSIVRLARDYDAVTVVRLAAPPPHMESGAPVLLYAKDAAAPVGAQFLRALPDGQYVVACRAADLGAIAFARLRAVQGVR